MSNINRSVVGGRLLRDEIERVDTQELNRPEEFMGDRCGVKDNGSLRIVSQNINGIGQTTKNIKEQNIKDFVHNFNVDILAMQELNVC